MQKSPVAYRYTNWSTIVPSQKIKFNHNLKAARGKLIEAQVEEDAAEVNKTAVLQVVNPVRWFRNSFLFHSLQVL
jgi:malonyl CoA-acyl carrier protein transacylase